MLKGISGKKEEERTIMKRIAMRSNKIFREGFDAEERGNDSLFFFFGFRGKRFWKGEGGKIRSLKRHQERDEMIVGPLSFLSDDPKNEKHSKH